MTTSYGVLKRLYEGRGPVASVYLDARSDVEDAAARLGVRWRSARRELTDQGAPEELLDVVDTAIAQGHSDGETIGVVASPRAILRVALPEPPVQDVIRLGPLPMGAPILENRQRAIPHVVVVTDRAGADIVQALGPDELGTTAVDGETLHITRSAPGGWSQRRFQQRAENVWEHNARLVADAVAGAADEIDARIIVVAGDVRAKGFLRDHLPAHLVARIVDAASVEPGRLADEVVRHVATVAAHDTRDLLRELREREHVARGARATFAALAVGAVDVLLVHDDPTDERVGWITDDPAVVGLDAAGVAGRSDGPPDRARLADVAIRAALSTSAGVRVIPDHVVDEGIAALLRFPVPDGT
jgi:Bacterial archaeo-eukaryotic release factor family 2